MSKVSLPGDLSTLHDIILPEPISWWPLGFAWWVLCGFILLSFCCLYLDYRRQYARNAYRKAALTALTALTPLRQCQQEENWQQIPIILKRCALAVWPRDEIASLTGSQWIDWLNAHGGNFDTASAAQIQQLLYNPTQLDTLDTLGIQQLVDQCEHWIRQHPQPQEGEA